MTTTRIGIIGCGTISGAYLRSLASFEGVEVIAVADLDLERAQAKAREHGVALAISPAALLAHEDVDLVVNLTVPVAHADITRAALHAGKAVYSEKPLAVTAADAQDLVALAVERGSALGCAPDTFLGVGLQTSVQALTDGVIGRPFAAVAHVVGRGPERWHHDPAFFYRPGAGPLFDMGPYYVTALVALLGPVASVMADATRMLSEREIESGPLAGTRFEVDVDTHVTALLRFAGGATATLLTSFDVAASALPRFEVFGDAGTLAVPDPNTFSGPVRVRGPEDEVWRDLPLGFGFAGNVRGLGAVEMVRAVRAGRPPRASGALAAHVLEVLEGAVDAAATGSRVTVSSRPPVPTPFVIDELHDLGAAA
ncbi:MAG: Gfo/Idh/MocA family oxidoreductase [Trueperaceae bacterium]|nr:Gfo/Idh/MocA family oxidoreductase [Trueperaceae bacterium]